MQNKEPKYNVSTTVCCPLCDNDIQVGTAGPQGLDQHQGKKKEEEQNGKKAPPLKTYIFVALLRKFHMFFRNFLFWSDISILGREGGEGGTPRCHKKFADPVQFLTSWDPLVYQRLLYTSDVSRHEQKMMYFNIVTLLNFNGIQFFLLCNLCIFRFQRLIPTVRRKAQALNSFHHEFIISAIYISIFMFICLQFRYRRFVECQWDLVFLAPAAPQSPCP